MKREFYPIGTIIELNEVPNRLFMLVGLLVQNDQGEQRDYIAVRYPIGAVDSDHFYFFNHSQINKVIYKGYENEDHRNYVQLINTSLYKNEDE